jgi:DNA invertase Pin-like site-specific DNA recombinase
MEASGELMFTILSSLAQEESRNISENTQWGIRSKFQQGIPHINCESLLGYDKDADGNKRLDTKNPDKSLRNTPCDRIILFSGLQYNADKKCWDGTKIYDPQRGIKARLTVTFEKDGRLRLKGSVFAFSESVYWKKVQ